MSSMTGDLLRKEQETTLSVNRRSYGFFAHLLFLLLDVFYGQKSSLSKFRAMELISSVTYQAWDRAAHIAMTHTYIWPDFARRIFKLVNEVRSQIDNEKWHLSVLEELVHKKGIQQNSFHYRFIPRVIAFFYYHMSWFLYLIKPAWSYRLNVDLEDYAEHEYMEFVRDNPQLEQEVFESSFKNDCRDFKNVGDLFRKIALDERAHKEASLARIENGDV